MTPLRKKRLLLLASDPNCWHKRFYSQYVELGRLGLTEWVLGTALLTTKGQRELLELLTDD